MHLPHQLSVAPRQVIVGRYGMHAFAGQGIEKGRQGRYECFALAGLHLGNAAVMQDATAE